MRRLMWYVHGYIHSYIPYAKEPGDTGGTYPHKILIIGAIPLKLFSHLINACSFCVVLILKLVHDDHYYVVSFVVFLAYT